MMYISKIKSYCFFLDFFFHQLWISSYRSVRSVKNIICLDCTCSVIIFRFVKDICYLKYIMLRFIWICQICLKYNMLRFILFYNIIWQIDKKKFKTGEKYLEKTRKFYFRSVPRTHFRDSPRRDFESFYLGHCIVPLLIHYSFPGFNTHIHHISLTFGLLFHPIHFANKVKLL